MCGIVGAAARRNIVPIPIEGLRRLEYRGYESCALALMHDDGTGLEHTLAHVSDLAALQLLAYQAALARAPDVDKPRNLAKSVTVE